MYLLIIIPMVISMGIIYLTLIVKFKIPDQLPEVKSAEIFPVVEVPSPELAITSDAVKSVFSCVTVASTSGLPFASDIQCLYQVVQQLFHFH